jgi:hypothetical protein
MAIAWQGPTLCDETLAFGPLALIAPLLQRLDLATIIDRHLPPDPQLRYSHGRVLSLLLAARLSRPTALVNIPAWAQDTGADLLWDIPAACLNDDRLGRALDAFFTQRHSILTCVAAEALRLAELEPRCLHFDPTHLTFYGAYEASQARSDTTPWPPKNGSADVGAAHITRGYGAEEKLIHVGVTSAVDELGALPILGHCLDGQHNGHTAIGQSCDWLLDAGLLRRGTLMVSDRGTFSVEHLARLNRHGCPVLCSAPWADYRALYDEHASRLRWRRASYLSQEQQRRREADSALPHEYYDLAVLRHTLSDPETKDPIACRIIFVYSSADAAICRQTRERDIERLRAGLDEVAASVARGHARTTQATIARRVTRLFGDRAARHFFSWEMVPLTAQEQAALPPPKPGCRRPAYRFCYRFDEAAAVAAAEYDGLAVLVTTTARTQSADALFTEYKRQSYVELGHHQWKTPLAVRPVFLKSPARVEALVCLMQVALTAYQLLERLYRRSVPADAEAAERRLTTERLLGAFASYGLIARRGPQGVVVHATQLNSRQRQILQQIGFPTPTQLLASVLPPHPDG